MKRLSKKRLALLTLCVCSAIANSGFAAETEDIDVYGGDEFVVTATRTKLEAKEVPVAAEVITEQKIKDLGAYSVQDALRLAANVDVQDAGMTGNQVMLRGNDSKHTLILVDGKRMAGENSDSAINAYELKRINIADVERIEIIRGNSSALYGADALGGVVNIITKTPDKARTSIGMHTGTKDEAVNFSYSSGKTGNDGKFSFKLGGGVEKIREINSGSYDNYVAMNGVVSRKSVVDSTNMYGIRRFLNSTLKYDFNDTHSLAFDMNFMREQFNAKTNDSDGADYVNSQLKEVRPDTWMPSASRYPMLKYYSYNNNRSDYGLTYKGSDGKHDYNIRAYMSQLRKENNTKYYAKGDSTTTDLVKKGQWTLIDYDQNNYKNYVIEANDTYKMDDHNTLSYGLEYRKDYMDGSYIGKDGSKLGQVGYGNIIKDSSEVSVETGAFYLQDELKIGDKLILFPAVRIDHHETFGTHTSPKIGATYSLSNNSRIKANWGKGFRAPTLYELYSRMAKSGMMPMTVHMLGNKDLEPEKSTNFDISFEAEKKKTNFKVSYYHNDIENMIDSIEYNGPLADASGLWYQYVNRGEVEISGAEAEIGYNFDEHWSIKGAYNYLDAKDKNTGERLTYRARQSGLVQLTYTDAKENPLTVNLYNRFYIDYHTTNETSAMYQGQNLAYTQDYTYGVTGLVVNKQVNKTLRIFAGIDNIFDKKFYRDSTFNSYTIDGRTWRVGAEMTF